MKALIVVDMIHDFVDGKFGSEAARGIVPGIGEAIRLFREKGYPVIFLKDSHTPDDPELLIWGEHAMRGTWGSEIVEDLSPQEGDVVVEKTTYDGFFRTDLERILKDRGVEEVYLCGVATDICVLHTAFGAFARGFRVHIIEDLCAGTSEEMHSFAIDYMRRIYGADIIKGDAL